MSLIHHNNVVEDVALNSSHKRGKLKQREGCVFCQRIESRQYDYEYFQCVTYAPRTPITAGHVIVVPKNHSGNVTQMAEDAARAMKCAALIIRNSVEADDYMRHPTPYTSIVTSTGSFDPLVITHTHLHLVPRRADENIDLGELDLTTEQHRL